jgi:predicted DNA-binding transcriptional regulator AlpA
MVTEKAGASIPKLAIDYDVSEALLYSLANQGRLPGCRRLGHRFVVYLPTFERWMAEGMGDEIQAQGS